MRFLIVALAMLVATTAWGQILVEDFEAGVPPAGWTMINNVAPPAVGCYWADNVFFGNVNNTGGTGKCAECDSDWFGSGCYLNTELISPVFYVGVGAALDYDTVYSDLLTGNDYADTDISIDGGVTWVNLLRWDSDHYSVPWHVTLNLAAYVGNMAQIRFHYWDGTTTGWDWYWQVDHVVISGASAVESESWGSIKSMFR